MKEKILGFLKEKKDLLLFCGILCVIFVGVILIANYALDSDSKVSLDDTPQIEPGGDDPVVTPPTPVTPEYHYLEAPIDGDYILVRTFFDYNYEPSELEKAVIKNDGNYDESTSVCFGIADNQSFNVYTASEGTVLSVLENEINGYVVSVDHGNNIVIDYSSLSSTNVKAGDTIEDGALIGVSGTSVLDNEAGVHVNVSMKINDNLVDFTKYMGMKVSDVNLQK